MYFIASSSDGISTQKSTFQIQIDPSMIILAIILGILLGAGIVTFLINNGKKEGSKENPNSSDIKWGNVEAEVNLENISNLTIREVLDWFYSKREIKTTDENYIAFTVGGTVESGSFKEELYNRLEEKYNLVQGFYNKLTGDVVEYRMIKSDNMDDDLKENHQNNLLNTYK